MSFSWENPLESLCHFLFSGKMASTTLTARFNQSVTKEALRSYLAEFISTFFYVFAVVGSAMASSQYPEQF